MRQEMTPELPLKPTPEVGGGFSGFGQKFRGHSSLIHRTRKVTPESLPVSRVSLEFLELDKVYA